MISSSCLLMTVLRMRARALRLHARPAEVRGEDGGTTAEVDVGSGQVVEGPMISARL